MKTYIGYRDPQKTNGRGENLRMPCRVFVENGSVRKPLSARWDVKNHSPDGFEWGYAGSGPAQLALALCLDCLGDSLRAQAVYQRIKREIVMHFDHYRWSLGEEALRSAINAALAEIDPE